MSTIVTLDEKANRAGQLLRDPVVIEALDTIRQNCFNQIESSLPDDERVREKAYMKLCALEDLRNELENWEVSTKIAERKARQGL